MLHSSQWRVLKASSARKGEIPQRVRVSVMSQAHFQKLTRNKFLQIGRGSFTHDEWAELSAPEIMTTAKSPKCIRLIRDGGE